jgi:hypothetical protein
MGAVSCRSSAGAWEAVLGAGIALPTPAGTVNLKVRRTRAGQQLRLAGRGLARPDGSAGNLFAIVQIAVPLDGRRAESSFTGNWRTRRISILAPISNGGDP